MQKDWAEIEIKNFLGISTQRTPQINECADCRGFDLRDTHGDLVGIDVPLAVDYLSPPYFSLLGFSTLANLGFTTHVFSQLGGVQKEVTFYFQRGTVGGYPHIAIGMRPHYTYGGWNDSWRWLNKTVVTTIASVISTYQYTFADNWDADGFVYGRFTSVFNVTKNQWGVVTGTVAGTPTKYNITNSGWAVSDVVIIMLHYQPLGSTAAPFPYFTEQANIVTADLSFHRVLNELRIGWGSKANRLAVGIGYKKKYFQIDTLTNGDTLTNVTDLDDIILNPYNIISDAGTFSFGAVTFNAGTGLPGDYFPEAFGKTFYLRMTAILDDYSEFLVLEQSNTYTGTVPIYSLQFQPLIRFATMNKRVTKIRVWLAGSGTKGERSEDYKLVWEKDIAKSTPLTGLAWTLDSDGFLKLTSSVSYMTITYSMYTGETETQALRMTGALGYTATTQYASSWDQALVVGGATYLLNPYVDKSWKNFIFNSPISGAGASQYDVISAENYQSLDTKDGNDIVGIELNSNLDLSVFRTTGFQQYSPTDQVPTQIIAGNGASSRLGIVNTGGLIFFPSAKDIFINGGNQLVNISEKTIRDYYRSLTEAQKASIIGGKDKDGSYRFIATALPSQPEYMFIKDKGWIKTGLDGIIYYGNRMDGTLLYMTDIGGLRQIDEEANVFRLSAWISIPIDISLMGEGIPSDARFVIGSIWLEYTSDVVIALSISYEGASFISIGNLPANISTLTGVATDATNNNFIKPGHGLTENDRVTLSNIVTTTGITSETPYYVILVDSSTFKLSLTKSGSAVDLLTGDGSCTVRKTIPTLIKRELRLPPGRNAKYFQVKLSCTSLPGDSKTRISAVGIRWKMFKTGLFR